MTLALAATDDGEASMARKPTTRSPLSKVTDLLARSRWTVVESYEVDGARYIVAREDAVDGVAHLTDRERQAIASLATGQSTKETAYALGITDVTVRVLLARAATKLGVRSRRELLEHAEVRALRPPGRGPRG
jgi:DNA-binding CsgD family transcriptional regulator